MAYCNDLEFAWTFSASSAVAFPPIEPPSSRFACLLSLPWQPFAECLLASACLAEVSAKNASWPRPYSIRLALEVRAPDDIFGRHRLASAWSSALTPKTLEGLDDGDFAMSSTTILASQPEEMIG